MSAAAQKGTPRPRVLIALLVASMAAFTAMVSLGYEFSLGIRELRAAPEDNAMWAIYQIQYELARTQISALEISPDKPETARAFIKRFDILYSRFGLVDARNSVSQPVEQLQAEPGWRQLQDFFAQTSIITEGGPEAVIARRSDILSGLQTIEPEVRRIVLDSLQHRATHSDERRLSLISTANAGALLIVTLMVMLIGVIVVLVLQGRALMASKQALESSEQQKSAIIAAALDAIIVTDQQGTVLEGNAAITELFGRPPESLERKNIIAEAVPERLQRHFRRILSRGLPPFAAGRGKRIEMMARRADGGELPVEISFTVAPGRTGPIVVIFARDITRRKAQARANREAQARMERENQAKARFVAFVSHELRTPLSSLLLTLDLLRQPHRDDERSGLITAATLSSEALLAIVNDVLDLSRIESGSVALETGPCDVAGLAREAAEIVMPSARLRGNSISLDIAPEALGSFEVSGGRVRQILLNLLSNANRFTSNGEITIGLRRSGPEEITLSVNDTGSGIAPERLDAIFDEFITGTGQPEPVSDTDRGEGGQTHGTGLGLPISRALAIRMGGQLSVESRPGAGSTFNLVLPVKPSAAIATRISAPAPAAPADILVIDDDRLNAAALARHLEGAGHRVTLARDGESGVAAVMAGHFDLIFLDLLMPGLDGAETARRIRALAAGSGVPIIAITAYASKADRLRFAAAGVDDYLPKPLRRDGVLEALAQNLRRARGAS